MIIDTAKKNIEIHGDVKEFKTSIDPKNIELITTLLSSNLYSDPEQSFIREIVSNAWDSHVEAGTTQIPIIVSLEEEPNKSITIRDFGTGLSPERFQEVYCSIGSSTKRESNKFIGGFGIGKYSSLACTNIVHITSYYEGIAYQYIMAKSGNSITTNLVTENPTLEKNGVKITIQEVPSLTPYYKALSCIMFFPNVFIDGTSSKVDAINKAKIKRFRSFSVSSYGTTHKILLGNVLYPCNYPLLSSEASRFISSIYSSGAVLNFEVGELDITPNRESIIYTPSTTKKIERRALEAQEELCNLIRKNLKRDHTDIVEYWEAINQSRYYDPIGDVVSHTSGERRLISIPHITKDVVTFRGRDLKESISSISSILSTRVPQLRGLIDYDGIKTPKTLSYSSGANVNMSTRNLVLLSPGCRLTRRIREFLLDRYPSYGLAENFSFEEFKMISGDSLFGLTESLKDIITSGVYDHIMSIAKKVDFDTDTEYLEFLKETPLEEIVRLPDKVILYEHYFGDYKSKHVFNNIPEAIRFLNMKHCGIILFERGETNLNEITSVAHTQKIKIFSAKKATVNKLKSLKSSCLVDPDWVLFKNPLLNKLYTIKLNFPEIRNPYFLDDLLKLLPPPKVAQYTVVKELICYMYSYPEYTRVAISNGKLDPELDFVCKRVKDDLEKFNKARDIVTSSECSASNSLLVASVIKRQKMFRMRYQIYNQIKNNTLINILCGKY